MVIDLHPGIAIAIAIAIVALVGYYLRFAFRGAR